LGIRFEFAYKVEASVYVFIATTSRIPPENPISKPLESESHLPKHTDHEEFTVYKKLNSSDVSLATTPILSKIIKDASPVLVTARVKWNHFPLVN